METTYGLERIGKLLMEVNQIICGDSLSIMKTFSDKSIDLTLTDFTARIGSK